MGKKRGYDAEKNAAFTLREIDKWFVIYVAKKYHHDSHRELDDMTSMEKCEQGTIGNSDDPGVEIPKVPSDLERVKLDLMPFFVRKIMRYGVVFQGIVYNDDVLTPYGRAMDPDNPDTSRKFVFRRDPDNLNVIYFWNPDLEQYFEIPIAFRLRPLVNLSERSVPT